MSSNDKVGTVLFILGLVIFMFLCIKLDKLEQEKKDLNSKIQQLETINQNQQNIMLLMSMDIKPKAR